MVEYSSKRRQYSSEHSWVTATKSSTEEPHDVEWKKSGTQKCIVSFFLYKLQTQTNLTYDVENQDIGEV